EAPALPRASRGADSRRARGRQRLAGDRRTAAPPAARRRSRRGAAPGARRRGAVGGVGASVGEAARRNAARADRVRRAAGGRVLAAGTTTVRVLESLAREAPLAGRTGLFVTPGFEFRRVDSLLTNFHLPQTTLLALVMAFAGIEETRELYRLAIAERYRFYSF